LGVPLRLRAPAPRPPEGHLVLHSPDWPTAAAAAPHTSVLLRPRRSVGACTWRPWGAALQRAALVPAQRAGEAAWVEAVAGTARRRLQRRSLGSRRVPSLGLCGLASCSRSQAAAPHTDRRRKCKRQRHHATDVRLLSCHLSGLWEREDLACLVSVELPSTSVLELPHSTVTEHPCLFSERRHNEGRGIALACVTWLPLGL
jgi:hypothetical protein